MPRFFFFVFNGNGETPDDEGIEIADQAGARSIALESIRSIVAEEARGGTIDLTGRVEIKDGTRNLLFTVEFSEAFILQLPQGTSSP